MARSTNTRIYKIVALLYGGIFVMTGLAILLGLGHLTGYRSLPEEERAFGLGGSVRGRVFTAPFAAGHFTAGASGTLRLNLDNRSRESYRLTLRSGGDGDGRTLRQEVPPGLTKLKIKDGGNPVYIEFRWDHLPDGVVLNTVDSTEYGRFRHLMAALAALAILTGAFYFFAAIREKKNGRRRAAVCVFFAFLSGYFFVFDRAQIPLTGDEPHYLVLAESLARDGDLYLDNNYNSIWRNMFYPGALDPHTTPVGDDEIASHYPLLALLLGPAMLGPVSGLAVHPYVAGKLIMMLLAAGTAMFVFARVLRNTRRGAPRLTGGLLVLVLFSSLPFLPYSNQIFPELLAGLLLFTAVSGVYDRTLRPVAKGRVFELGNFLQRTLPVILLPWCNLKFALPALVLGMYLLWQNRGSPTRFFWTAAGLGGGVIAFVGFTYTMYGSFLGPYGGQAIVLKNFAARYAAYLFDADRGLVALQPLVLWAAPGLAIFWRRSRSFSGFLFVLILAGHLPNIFQADETNWLLGYCPAGRYWIAVFPLIAWAAARGMAAMTLWPRTNLTLSALRAAALCLTVPALLIGFAQTAAFLDFQESVYLPLKTAGNAARFVLATTGLSTEHLFAYFPFEQKQALEAWIIAALPFALLGWTISVRRGPKRKSSTELGSPRGPGE